MKQLHENQRKSGLTRVPTIFGAMLVWLALGVALGAGEAHMVLPDRLWRMAIFLGMPALVFGAGFVLLWRAYVASHDHGQAQAIAALRESEARFHQMFEAHGAIMLLIDPQNGMIFDANHAAVQFYRYSKSELCALNINQINMLSPAQVAAEYTRALHEERSYFVFPHRLADGTVRTVEVYSSPIAVQAKRVLFSIIHDVTERKQAEDALRQSEEEHRRTLEARVAERTAEVQDLYEKAPIGYHSLDADGTLMLVNQTQLLWLGYTREQMIGRPLTQFLAPNSLKLFNESFATFKRCGWVRDVELNMCHRDGTVIPVLLSATAVYDAQGGYVMSRSAVFNNTLRKQAEDALRQSEEQNRLLFAESPEAVVLFDERGRVVQANRAFTLLTGYSVAALVGHSLEELRMVSPEQTALLSPRVREQVQHNDSFAITEFRLADIEGTVRDVEARTLGLGLNGRQHYLIAMRDITIAKQAAETLRHANAELARAARTKDEFLANMSHELRTPLNAILGLSESLLEEVRGPLNQRQHDSLRSIESSGRHLLALINDILDLSKVEAGRLDLQKETFSVADVCQASLIFVKEQALKKSIKLALHLNDQLAELQADPRRLKQMLVNLLSNAVKFTPDGGSVSLDVVADPEEGVISFVVTDTGIGIAPADLGRLFQPFHQLDSSLSRQHEGSGLGLALVRKLSELHGGRAMAESEEGKGSRFTIALPYAPSRRAPPPAGPRLRADPLREVLATVTASVDRERGGLPAAPLAQPAPTGIRVLLVEDNEANIFTLCDYLKGTGCQVTVARNGREAIDRAGTARFDVILMDIQMPEMDGLEATHRLRAIPACAATPIIALTALAMPGDRDRCLAAGANEYLTKPVSLRALLDVIRQQIAA